MKRAFEIRDFADNMLMRSLLYSVFAVGVMTLSSFFAPVVSAQEMGGSGDQFQAAEKYFYQKQYGAAKKELLAVIQSNPNHPKAYSYLGDIALTLGDYQEALRYYEAAKKVSATPDKEYFRIGQVYIEMEQADQAIDSFGKAYTLNPSLKPALYQKGYVYLVFKRDKALTVQYWKQFLAESPNDPQYENIRKVIALLEDENFVLPPAGSDVSLEEALRLGGKTLEADGADNEDQSAGHEDEKTRTDTEGLLDSLNGDDL